MRIAVTGMGTATGEAVVRDLRRCLPDAWILGLDLSPWAPGLALCDARDRLPAARNADFVEALVDITTRNGIDVLVPGLDLELPDIAQARPLLAQRGCTTLISEPAAIDLCQDKLACAQAFGAAGLPFVTTLGLAEWTAEPARIPGPVVLKPRRGSGSKGIHILLEPGAGKLPLDQDLVVQPYVVPVAWSGRGPGPLAPELVFTPDGGINQEQEVGVQAVFGPAGEVAGMYATTNHLVRGFPVRHTPLDLGPSARPIMAMFELLGENGLRGPCNLQGRMGTEGFLAYEVNPRFSAGTAARAGLGFEEVIASIRLLHLGDPVNEVAKILSGRQDRICMKVASEVFVDRRLLES